MPIAEVIHVEGAVAPTEQTAATTEQVTTEQTTPATEVQTTAAAETQPVTESYDWLKKHNINSENDLTTVFERERQLQAKVQELEQKTSQPTYKTDFARIADELSSKGVAPQTIARFAGLNPQEMDAKSAILTKLEIELPKLTPDQRLAYYEETYGGLDDNDSILTEGQKAARMVQLEKDGATAREVLGQYIYEVFNPNQISPEIQQKEAQRREFWNKEGIGRISSLNEVKLPSTVKLPGQNGAVEEKPFDFVYQVPTEASQALLKEFSETVENPLFGDFFDQSEQGIANANKTYQKMFWGENGETISKKIMEHAAQRESMIHEHYAKLLNNTQFKGLSADVSTDKSVSPDMGMAAFLKKGGRG